MTRRLSLPLAAAWLAVAAAQLPAQRPQPGTGGTIVIAGSSDLQPLNSLVNTDAWTREVVNNALFVPLLRYSPDLSYQPGLAQSWQLLGDTGVVFRLRRDVFWHDGVHTTAHDVAFTFERAREPATAFPNADLFALWQSVQVIDSFTIRFRFKPHADPLAGWAQTPPMPRHLLDSIAPARLRLAAFNHAPVGNGPFRFVSRQPNDRWVFEANPTFPRGLGGPPRSARLIWRVVPDNTAQVSELLTGQAQLILGARAEQVKQLQNRAGMRVLLRPSLRYAMIVWNGRRPPLGDARVRRALTMLLDRQEMVAVVRGGYAQVASSPVPPFHWAYDRSVRPLPFDTTAARALLRQAGFADRDRDGVLEDAQGRPLEVELKVAANNSFNRDVGELVRAQLARGGVRVRVNTVDFAVMIEDISSPARNFGGAFLQFSTDPSLNFRAAFHSSALDGPFQSASYSNPELDALLDRVQLLSDRAAARPVWARVQRILRDDQPWTFLWWSPDMLVASARLQGIEPDLRGTLYSVAQWRLARP